MRTSGLVFLLLLSACGGGDDSANLGTDGGDGAADGAADGADGAADGADGADGGDGADGTDGGVTYTAGGAQMTVPDGAAPEGVVPEIATGDPGVPTQGYHVEGSIYALTPHGTEFSAPVAVSLPILNDVPELAVLKLDGPDDTEWSEIEWARDGDAATFSVDSFSYYALASGGGGAPDNDSDGFDATSDCDDSDPSVNPGATEVCDEKDNDCDGLVDEGVATDYCSDADADGTGDPATRLAACSRPTGYVADCTDCNDGDAGVVGGCR